MSFDIDRLEAPGATGAYNSALHAKAATVADALTGVTLPEGQEAQQGQGQGQGQGGAGSQPYAGYEFGFVHVKAVDDTGHDRMVAMKVGVLMGWVESRELWNLCVSCGVLGLRRELAGDDGLMADEACPYGGSGVLRGCGAMSLAVAGPVPQVRFQEAVDAMVGQLLRRLWEAEAAGRGRYVVAVTGDHSTPVVFGDHSHEPVPFAVATVKHAVEVSAWRCAGQRCVHWVQWEQLRMRVGSATKHTL